MTRSHISVRIKIFVFLLKYITQYGCFLKIDTGGWSVNYCARFNEATTKCSLAN